MPRPPQLLPAALTLFALGLAAFAWKQRLEILRLSRALEQKDHVTVAAQNRDPTGPIPTLTRASAVPLTRPAAASGPARDDESTLLGVVKVPKARRAPSGVARLMTDPEFMRAFSLHQQGALDNRFAELFRRLKLSPDELAAFKRLLAEKESVALDVVAISQDSPDGPMPANELQASIAAAQSQVETAILNSLGSDRYAVYRDFERTLPQRTVVARLEQRLSYTSTPLQPAQADALVRILAREAPAEPAPSRPVIAVLPGPASPAESPIIHSAVPAPPVSEAALTESQTVLSPPQVAALREVHAEIDAAAQATQILNGLVPPRSGDGDRRPVLQILLP